MLLSVSGRYRTCLGGADLLRTVEPTFFTMEPTFCVPDIAEIMQAKERARGALVDPHAQLASPRAALRQAALEQLSELAPSLLMQHAPAIVARLEDRQMSVRRAALHALRRLPAAALFDYLPAILERLEDKDDEVRDSAQEVLERLDSASGLLKISPYVSPISLLYLPYISHARGRMLHGGHAHRGTALGVGDPRTT